jgi:hypothetical protein
VYIHQYTYTYIHTPLLHEHTHTHTHTHLSSELETSDGLLRVAMEPLTLLDYVCAVKAQFAQNGIIDVAKEFVPPFLA